MPKVKVMVAALVLGGVLSAVGSASALANGGPHEGTFSVTTDACAGCHRAHTGQAEGLLRFNSQYNLCISCHDGSGANTAVTQGVYLGAANGTQNAGLKGGGFETALLNITWETSFNETGTPAPVTSKHSVGATNLMAWGAGTSGLGEVISDLECANCHNPHGNGNYRMLRIRPVGPSYNSSSPNITISGNDSATYTVSYILGNGNTTLMRDRTLMYNSTTWNGTAYASSPNSTRYMVDDWCAQCHTRYSNPSHDTYTGDATYTYAHYTGLSAGCFVCHVAHGTSATMSGYAASTVMWPGGSANQTWQTSGNESQTSRLLVANNRGACRQCHSNLNNN